MRAVFAFCEGAHDVAFVRRSLLAHRRGRLFNGPIKDLPTPLGEPADSGGMQPARASLIVRHHSRRHLGETPLSVASHAPPPVFDSVIIDDEKQLVYVLLRCHGDPTRAECFALVDDLATAFDPLVSARADLRAYAVAFVIDADEGLDVALARLGVCSARLGGVDPIEHGHWIPGSGSPIGCFVWHDNATRAGSLETHAEPIFASALGEHWHKACAYIDDVDEQRTLPPHSRIKAIATAAIQVDRPGSPLSLAFHRDIIDGEYFRCSPTSAAVVEFLAAPFTP